jgi:transposase
MKLDRIVGFPHYWSPQRLPKTQEEAFRQAVEQLQDRRGGGRVRGEDIRQLLAEQFDVTYTLNGVYELLKRLDMVWISARSGQAGGIQKKPRAGSASRSSI